MTIEELYKVFRRHIHDGIETEKLPQSSIIGGLVFNPSGTASSSLSPSSVSSFSPSISPSLSPSKSPSLSSSLSPSVSPSTSPSPSLSPSLSLSVSPSLSPSVSPSLSPSLSPSVSPSASPSPSISPSRSGAQSVSPSVSPSPSLSPSLSPSISPSFSPSTSSSVSPSFSPSKSPSFSPSISPSFSPSLSPSLAFAENTITKVLGEGLVANDAVMLASGTIVSNEITQISSGSRAQVYSVNWYGQTFLTNVFTKSITGVKLKFEKNGTPSSVMHVFLYATLTGLPTGVSLVDVTISPSTISASPDEYTVNFPTPVTVSPLTRYAIVLAYGNATSSNNIKVYYQDSDVYSDGNFISSIDSGVNWTADTGKDLYFKVMECFQEAGKIYKADGSLDNELAINFIGFAKENGSSGDVISVITGGVMPAFTGLIPGSYYYLSSTSGEISTTKTYPQNVGLAISATELLLDNQLAETVIVTASDNLKISADTERTAFYTGYQKLKEIQIYLSGTYRVTFDLKAAGSGFSSSARVYVNDIYVNFSATENDGGLYVNYSFDVTVKAGDKIQIYAQGNTGTNGPPPTTAYVRNFRLYYDKVLASQDNVIVD